VSLAIDDPTLCELASVDIAYEMEQYTLWITRVPPLMPGMHENRRLREATFEASVLHHRNLASFLRGSRPTEDQPHRRTDVVADHYFVKGWVTRPQPMRLYAASARQETAVRSNIDAHLAHITSLRVKRRTEGGTFSWNQVDQTLVLTAFIGFVDDLRSVHKDRSEWFNDPYGRAVESRQHLVDGRVDFGLVHTTSPMHSIVRGSFGTLPPAAPTNERP
jgi:hypothetical protein